MDGPSSTDADVRRLIDDPAPLREGATYFAVDNAWYSRWVEYAALPAASRAPDSGPGQIDNTALADPEHKELIRADAVSPSPNASVGARRRPLRSCSDERVCT
jgi:hypothetical protein